MMEQTYMKLLTWAIKPDELLSALVSFLVVVASPSMPFFIKILE
jgi:hypothetical protein